uniref:SRP_SPB domain-containing protein n=3 Tax=Heterorhabditis bacteriophora TaxID=37862 RepID=A0A1I7WDJ4_HETBA
MTWLRKISRHCLGHRQISMFDQNIEKFLGCDQNIAKFLDFNQNIEKILVIFVITGCDQNIEKILGRDQELQKILGCDQELQKILGCDQELQKILGLIAKITGRHQDLQKILGRDQQIDKMLVGTNGTGNNSDMVLNIRGDGKGISILTIHWSNHSIERYCGLRLYWLRRLVLSRRNVNF